MSKHVKVRDVISGRQQAFTESEFNNAMLRWSSDVQRIAKSAASAFAKGKRKSVTYQSGPKAGKKEFRLRSRVQYKLQARDGEAMGVVFGFPLHGVFREYGVGRGVHRGLINHTARTPSDWFSGALNKKEAELVDMVAEHKADCVTRVFKGL